MRSDSAGDRVDIETDRPSHAHLALEEPKLIAVRRDAQTADLVPVLRRARLGLQASIEPDAVLPHPHERRRRESASPSPPHATSIRSSAPLVHEHNIRPPLPRQVVGNAAPRNPPTNNHHARLPPHKREPPPICPGTRAKPENRASSTPGPSWRHEPTQDVGGRRAAGCAEGSTGPVPSKGHRKRSARMEPSRAGLAHACCVVRDPPAAPGRPPPPGSERRSKRQDG